MGDIFGNIFDDDKDKESGGVKIETATPPETPSSDGSVFGEIFTEQSEIRKQTFEDSKQEVDPEPEKTGFFASAVNAGKAVIGFGADVFNNISDRNAAASFEQREFLYGDTKIVTDPETGKRTITSDRLEAFRAAETPEERDALIDQSNQEIPLVKLLNTDTSKKLVGSVSEGSSNIPLKLAARVSAIGDQTYEEAYGAYLAERNDPENGAFKQFLFELQDSGPQTAIGALLAIGTSVATRNPQAGYAVSGAFYTALSADEQIQERGQVESLGNIAVDVVGDQVLNKLLVGTLGNTSEKALVNTLKGFGVEGSTEVAQSLLKYANDYENAGTDAEREKVLADAAVYVKDGGLAMEFFVGGTAGAVITGATSLATNPSTQPNQPTTRPNRNVDAQLENVDINKVRDQLVEVQENLDTDADLTTVTQLNQTLNEYATVFNDKPIFVPSDKTSSPLIEVETVKFPDGKFAVRYQANTSSQSFSAAYDYSNLKSDQKKATNDAVAEIKAAVETELSKPNLSPELKAELESVIDFADNPRAPITETSSKKADSEQVADTSAPNDAKKENSKPISTKKREKPPVSAEKSTKAPLKTQHKNVERTAKGVYRVTEYNKKGDAQGKVEAKVTKSKRNGKLFIETTKDGERVKRMSLEAAQKKYGTKNRRDLIELMVNGEKDKETGKFVLRKSNAPVIRNTTQNQAEKKPVKTKGVVKKSRAFKRVEQRLGDYAEDFNVEYNRLNLADDTAKALEFIEKFPKEAKRVALGMQGAPEGITDTAVSIALAEQAADSKDYALQAQLERSRSLRQTRRGQEIVAERGRFNENSPHFFIAQVLSARSERAGKTKFKFFSDRKGKTNSNTGTAAKLKEGTDGAKKSVKKTLSRTDLAQSVIDNLTC